jgi:hypothetical protein
MRHNGCHIRQRHKGANAMKLSKTRVVIVAAGLVGGRAAAALRPAGHAMTSRKTTRSGDLENRTLNCSAHSSYRFAS